MKLHPLIEEYDHIRRANGKMIKEFFNNLIGEEMSSITPVHLFGGNYGPTKIHTDCTFKFRRGSEE